MHPGLLLRYMASLAIAVAAVGCSRRTAPAEPSPPGSASTAAPLVSSGPAAASSAAGAPPLAVPASPTGGPGGVEDATKIRIGAFFAQFQDGSDFEFLR